MYVPVCSKTGLNTYIVLFENHANPTERSPINVVIFTSAVQQVLSLLWNPRFTSVFTKIYNRNLSWAGWI